MATIGKNILENLTTGMYADSKVIYREYVQNACDQIDKAVELGIIDREQAEVFISIKEDERFISVEDNATGVKEADFVARWACITFRSFSGRIWCLCVLMRLFLDWELSNKL